MHLKSFQLVVFLLFVLIFTVNAMTIYEFVNEEPGIVLITFRFKIWETLQVLKKIFTSCFL